MADKTLIAWTDHTFNAAWGCVKISPGCKNCYADALSARYGHDVWGPGKPRRMMSDDHWKTPLKWNAAAESAGQRSKVFCGSMFDWAEDHPDIAAVQSRLWNVIRETPWLDWQLLTKRAERVHGLLPSFWSDVKDHVWLGVSVENSDYVWRADHIRGLDAVVRFVSYEPALGPIAGKIDLAGIDWLIYGGESGNGHRPEDKQWARDIMAACADAGTAFFHKQSSAARTEMGIELDGAIVRNYPLVRTLCQVNPI